jgi:hypothetical protein
MACGSGARRRRVLVQRSGKNAGSSQPKPGEKYIKHRREDALSAEAVVADTTVGEKNLYP